MRLTGYLVAPDGRFAGTRVVDDADGVEVELAYGNAVLGRATTVDGVYRFPGLAPGGYQVRANLVGNIADVTNVITIVGWDLMAGDTLRLTSIGDLYPVPNPAADTVSISFRVFAGQMYDVKIRNLQAAPLRSLTSGIAATTGLRVVEWDGRDSAGNLATAAMYWVTFESGIDTRGQLLFR